MALLLITLNSFFYNSAYSQKQPIFTDTFTLRKEIDSVLAKHGLKTKSFDINVVSFNQRGGQVAYSITNNYQYHNDMIDMPNNSGDLSFVGNTFTWAEQKYCPSRLFDYTKLVAGIENFAKLKNIADRKIILVAVDSTNGINYLHDFALMLYANNYQLIDVKKMKFYEASKEQKQGTYIDTDGTNILIFIGEQIPNTPPQ